MTCVRRAGLGLLASLLPLACGAPDPPPNTGGTSEPFGACGRGIIAVDTDYTRSTNVSLVADDGTVLSSSIISSDSAPPGLSSAFSDDVVVPTMPQVGDAFALVDRGYAVLTWVSVASGAVVRQLNVGTGFASNPQDYVEVPPPSPGGAPAAGAKAYVSRYAPNGKPGRQPFDEGSDLLLVDPATGVVLGNIDLTPAMKGAGSTFYPRPNREVLAGGLLYVLLSAYDLDFLTAADSRIVTIDPTKDAKDAIKGFTVLDGLQGCLGLAVSPSGDELAVSCPALETATVGSFVAAKAGVAVLDRATMNVTGRWMSAQLGGVPPGQSLAFAGEDTLLFTTTGALAGDGSQLHPDTAVELTVSTGAQRVLVRSQTMPFSFGDVLCKAACGVCFTTDADRSVLHRFAVTGATMNETADIAVDPQIGLPPRYLDTF